jgi:hypothetical protein
MRYLHNVIKMVFGFLGAALVAAALLGGCGQKDPTSPPTGAIFVSSSIPGAAIFLNGVDSHRVTPDTLKNVAVGSHVVTVQMAGFISSPESYEVEVSIGQVAEVVFLLSRRRVVLLEHFTWVYCLPCPVTNAIINGLLAELGPENVVGIEYHPFPPDPFYDAASLENITRKNYYQVSGVPALFVDGLLSPGETDSLGMVAAVETRMDQLPPAAVEVTDTVTGQHWAGTARIIGFSDVQASDVRGFFVVLEREVHYNQPPGNNGEKDFYYVMRKMLPDASGEILNISAGDTLTSSLECDLHPDWDPAQIYSLYFVQDYLSKEVLQAGTSMP